MKSEFMKGSHLSITLCLCAPCFFGVALYCAFSDHWLSMINAIVCGYLAAHLGLSRLIVFIICVIINPSTDFSSTDRYQSLLKQGSAQDAHAQDAHAQDAHTQDAHAQDAHAQDAHAQVIAQGVINGQKFQVTDHMLLEFLKSSPHLTSRTALNELINFELLAIEAMRRGMGDSPVPQEVQKRSAIQRYLHDDFERTFNIDQIPEKYIQMAKRQNLSLFRHPELRKAVHILLKPIRLGTKKDPLNQEERQVLLPLVQRVKEDLKSDPPQDVDSFQKRTERYTQWMPKGYEVRFELLSRFSRKGPYVKAFTEACFLVTTPHRMTSVIETQFGFHIAWVTEVLPSKDTPESEIDQEVKQRILPEIRGFELRRLLTHLKKKLEVKRFDLKIDSISPSSNQSPSFDPPSSITPQSNPPSY